MPAEYFSGETTMEKQEETGIYEDEELKSPEQDESAEIAVEQTAVDESDREKTIEALIFVSPEPISEEILSEVTGLELSVVRDTVMGLIESYRDRDSGIAIREVGDGFAMYATPNATPFISRLIKSQVNPRLTRAALETLAIVAYLQPVSRGVIADLRGVHSEGVIKTLEERGLVRPVGKGVAPGYPVLYGTTRAFLERFGLRNIGELPDLDQFAPDEKTVERIKKTLSWEMSEEGQIAGEFKAGEDTEDIIESGDSFPEESGESY